ncbi:hypothetical protein ACS0TY_017369 [Phlomoides rotata]
MVSEPPLISMLCKDQMSHHNIHVSEPNEPAREGRYWGYQGIPHRMRAKCLGGL